MQYHGWISEIALNKAFRHKGTVLFHSFKVLEQLNPPILSKQDNCIPWKGSNWKQTQEEAPGCW